MFATCRTEFEAYAFTRREGLTASADHLLQEIRLRLRHLDWLYSRCMQLDSELEQVARGGTAESPAVQGKLISIHREQSVRESDPITQAQLPFQASDELWILLEAFYYSAHRVRDILRDHQDEFPGFRKFEAIGVRQARNHLVEHISRPKGVKVPSIAFGGRAGPRLRVLRWSKDSEGSLDSGLQANADEFVNALTKALQRARGAA